MCVSIRISGGLDGPPGTRTRSATVAWTSPPALTTQVRVLWPLLWNLTVRVVSQSESRLTLRSGSSCSGAPASSSHLTLTRWRRDPQSPSARLLRRRHCSEARLPGGRVSSGALEGPGRRERCVCFFFKGPFERVKGRVRL